MAVNNQYNLEERKARAFNSFKKQLKKYSFYATVLRNHNTDVGTGSSWEDVASNATYKKFGKQRDIQYRFEDMCEDGILTLINKGYRTDTKVVPSVYKANIKKCIEVMREYNRLTSMIDGVIDYCIGIADDYPEVVQIDNKQIFDLLDIDYNCVFKTNAADGGYYSSLSDVCVPVYSLSLSSKKCTKRAYSVNKLYDLMDANPDILRLRSDMLKECLLLLNDYVIDYARFAICKENIDLVCKKAFPFSTFYNRIAYPVVDDAPLEVTTKYVKVKDTTEEAMLAGILNEVPQLVRIQRELDIRNSQNVGTIWAKLCADKFLPVVKKKGYNYYTSLRMTNPFCNTGNDIDNPEKRYQENTLLRSIALRQLFGNGCWGHYDINASIHRMTMSWYAGRYISTEEIPDIYALFAGKKLSREKRYAGFSERDAWKNCFNRLFYSEVYSDAEIVNRILKPELKKVDRQLVNGKHVRTTVPSEQDIPLCNLIGRLCFGIDGCDASRYYQQKYLKDANGEEVVVNGERVAVAGYKEPPRPTKEQIRAYRDKAIRVYGGLPIWNKAFVIESLVMYEVQLSLEQQGYRCAVCYDSIYTDRPLAKTEEEANAKFEEELAKAFDIVYQQIKVEEE